MIDFDSLSQLLQDAVSGGLTCGVMVGAVFAFLRKIG